MLGNKLMTKVIFCLLLTFISMATIDGEPRAGRPNFTGTWQLRLSQSGNAREKLLNDGHKLSVLMRDAIESVNFLTITHRDSQFEVSDNTEREWALSLDGRKVEQTTQRDGKIVGFAQWEGDRLSFVMQTPDGGKIVEIFELASMGRRLSVTVRLESQRLSRPLVIRRVYERVGDIISSRGTPN